MPEIAQTDSLNEANQRINIWKGNNPPSKYNPEPLDLSGIGLTDNDMQQLSQRLAEISNVKILDIANNELTKLPSEIGKLDQLEVMIASANKLDTIPSEIENLHELKRLDLQNNRLSELAPEIGNLKELRSLDLENNKLRELPPAIGNLETLVRLDLKNNKLEELPPEIGQLDKLKSLTIDNNSLTELPAEITKLNNLQSLFAENNQLIKLPNKIAELKNLEFFNVGNNNLKAFPEGIGALKSLVELNASNNEISKLNTTIGNLKQLEFLDIGNNQIRELPSQIGNLNKLEILNIESNKLKELPPQIERLKNLQEINVSDNRLSKLPREMNKLFKVKVIKADNNKLKSLPSTIGTLNKLEILSLENNMLKELPPQLEYLKGLKTLDVGRNQLKELIPEIKELQNLTYLYADNNQLTEVPTEIKELTNLEVLEISRNPLTEKTVSMLENSFPVGGNTQLSTVSGSGKKLKALFPNESPNKIREMDYRIGMLSKESNEFTNGNDQKPEVLPGDKVVDTFLSHVKSDHGGAEVTQHYHNATKHLLDRAIGSEAQDSEAALTQMASSLGNCPTPVRDLMERTGVQLALESGKPLSSTLKTMLHRQAFEEQIKKIVPNDHHERIEVIQGLANTLFHQGAETNQYNNLVIEGDRPRIPSKTGNIDFAFSQITDPMREAFSKMCCKTDNANNTVVDNEGNYQLDNNKYNDIVEPYLEKIGILDTKAQARKEFMAKVENFFRQPENEDLWVKPELMDMLKIEKELRKDMSGIADNKVEAFVQERFEAFKTEMQKELTNLKQEENNQNLNAVQLTPVTQNHPQNALLAGMTVPINQDRGRSISEDRNRNNNSNQNANRRNRGRSI